MMISGLRAACRALMEPAQESLARSESKKIFDLWRTTARRQALEGQWKEGSDIRPAPKDGSPLKLDFSKAVQGSDKCGSAFTGQGSIKLKWKD